MRPAEKDHSTAKVCKGVYRQFNQGDERAEAGQCDAEEEDGTEKPSRSDGSKQNWHPRGDRGV